MIEKGLSSYWTWAANRSSSLPLRKQTFIEIVFLSIAYIGWLRTTECLKTRKLFSISESEWSFAVNFFMVAFFRFTRKLMRLESNFWPITLMHWISTEGSNCHFNCATFRLPWIRLLHCPSKNFFLFSMRIH